MNYSLFIRLAVAAILLSLPEILFAQNIASPELVNSYKQLTAMHDASPVASNDYLTGPKSRSISGSLLANDHDPAGKTLTAYLVTPSPHGAIDIDAQGVFTFTPNSDFVGSATTFSYKACNGTLCSETAIVTISFPADMMLPVMLVDFKANYQNGKEVVLNWTTSFENNNDRFEVERSLDGTNFTKVGEVKGSGTTNLVSTYSFTNKISRQTTDKNDVYYRLKQVTTDNRSLSSKILIVRVYNTKSLELVSISPNPAVNDIKVNVQLNENAYVVIKVLNSAGKEVMRRSVKSLQGLNSYTLDGSSALDKGVYFLEMLVNSNERMMVQLMKD